MQIFATFFAFWSILSAVAFSLPIPRNDVALEKRNTHSGKATYYYADGNGACGSAVHDNEPVVAISKDIWNGGNNCNQWVEVSFNGRTIHGQVLDQCGAGGCDTGYNLDLSSSLFKQLANTDAGVIQVDWSFKPKGWSP